VTRQLRPLVLFSALIFAVAFAITVTLQKQDDIASVTARYEWTKLLPPPPRPGSSDDQRDLAAIMALQSGQGGARWHQATRDVQIDVFGVYGPIMGPDFNARSKPEVAALFTYVNVQLNNASGAAKATFNRPRPYVANPKLRLCTNDTPNNTSYPSGHAGWGQVSADILADLVPAKADALHARGLDFGQSRVVCAFHYPSDVVAGQAMGKVLLAALRADPEYQRLFLRAREAG
jgi:acid phosphatase (class A)